LKIGPQGRMQKARLGRGLGGEGSSRRRGRDAEGVEVRGAKGAEPIRRSRRERGEWGGGSTLQASQNACR